ncbi:MAG: hypothetical protein K2J65_11080 [Duncaniella sp.]|nr:hypothetical protein [Duncaniella sp.]
MGTTTNNTGKVGFAALNSANVRLDNSQDDTRKYDVAANASISGTEITSIDSGSVTAKDGMQVASFSSHGGNNANYNFYNVAPEQQCEVLAEIQDFIAGAKALVANSPITANNN